MGAAALAGFVLTRSNTSYSTEKIVLKGSFRCHKSGKSKAQGGSKRGTAKTDCSFKLNFRLRASEKTYHFTEHCELAHNHPINPSSTTMTAMARRFTPKQLDLIESMHANGSPALKVVIELRKTTDVVIQKKDVYNAFPRTQRAHVDGVSEVQDFLQAMDGHPDFTYVVEADEKNQLKGITFACRDSRTVQKDELCAVHGCDIWNQSFQYAIAHHIFCGSFRSDLYSFMQSFDRRDHRIL